MCNLPPARLRRPPEKLAIIPDWRYCGREDSSIHRRGTMPHLFIMIIFFTVLLGTVTVLYIHQRYQAYSFPFLKCLALNTACFNLGMLGLLVVSYLKINLPGSPLTGQTVLADNLQFLLSGLVQLGMLITLGGIVRGFAGRTLPPRWPWWFAAMTGCMLFCARWEGLLELPGWVLMLQWLGREYLFDNLLLLELVLLAVILIQGKRPAGRDWERISRIFAWLYLTRYTVLIPVVLIATIPAGQTLSLHAVPPAVRLILTALFLFSLNIFPWLWTKQVFLPEIGKRSASLADPSGLEIICNERRISKREREVLLLVLAGKSNREIEEALFISYHTVKNHIYNLYQKLEVKNRYQLINRFNQPPAPATLEE